MALLNPVYAFIVPFLFVVTVPLALFAGFTTIVAFAVLILRVLVVYVDIALSLLPPYLAALAPGPRKPATTYADLASRSPSPAAVPLRANASARRRHRHHHRRPSSSASAVSVGSITPVSENPPAAAAAAGGSLGLIPSVGPERDFEGLGGWRVGGDGADDDAWTTINSRSDLHGLARNHHRSVSGGGGPPTPGGDAGYLMMKARTRSPEAKRPRSSTSPNSSRARTPSGSRGAAAGRMHGGEGYFPMTAAPQKPAKKAST